MEKDNTEKSLINFDSLNYSFVSFEIREGVLIALFNGKASGRSFIHVYDLKNNQPLTSFDLPYRIAECHLFKPDLLFVTESSFSSKARILNFKGEEVVEWDQVKATAVVDENHIVLIRSTSNRMHVCATLEVWSLSENGTPYCKPSPIPINLPENHSFYIKYCAPLSGGCVLVLQKKDSSSRSIFYFDLKTSKIIQFDEPLHNDKQIPRQFLRFNDLLLSISSWTEYEAPVCHGRNKIRAKPIENGSFAVSVFHISQTLPLNQQCYLSCKLIGVQGTTLFFEKEGEGVMALDFSLSQKQILSQMANGLNQQGVTDWRKRPEFLALDRMPAKLKAAIFDKSDALLSDEASLQNDEKTARWAAEKISAYLSSSAIYSKQDFPVKRSDEQTHHAAGIGFPIDPLLVEPLSPDVANDDNRY